MIRQERERYCLGTERESGEKKKLGKHNIACEIPERAKTRKWREICITKVRSSSVMNMFRRFY